VQRLVASGATAIVSVGLAGGLDPALRPGFVLVPNRVWTGHGIVATDPALAERLGGSTGHLLLAGDHVAATASAKAAFRAETGADAVDLETGAALRAARAARLPFAALRAVCDPAERSLPPAALVALDARGAIGLARVLQSVAYDPRQIYALITLAADAWAARAALRRHIRSIQPG
jgi:adenosylhomocysteine nucleosidase